MLVLSPTTGPKGAAKSMFWVEKSPVEVTLPLAAQSIRPCPLTVPLTSATTPSVRRVNWSGWKVGPNARPGTLRFAWPLSVERANAAMIKAAREAKTSTSWTSPDEAYEAALSRFVEASLSDAAFVDALERFVTPLVEPGRIVSLAQTLLLLN